MLKPLALIFCFGVAFCFNIVATAKPLTVIVDPGHGGSDTGATRGIVRESEIVLNISKELQTLLNDNKDFQVILTRSSDHLMTLEERTLLADKRKADLFVSVHANSSPTPSAKGVEIYFQNQMPPDEESLYLANRENEGMSASSASSLKPKGDLAGILDDLHRQNQIYLSYNFARDIYRRWPKVNKSRVHIRQAPFHVLSEIRIPSILIETGFITNAQDSQRLSDPAHQKEIAQIIYAGLLDYRQRWISERR